MVFEGFHLSISWRTPARSRFFVARGTAGPTGSQALGDSALGLAHVTLLLCTDYGNSVADAACAWPLRLGCCCWATWVGSFERESGGATPKRKGKAKTEVG